MIASVVCPHEEDLAAAERGSTIAFADDSEFKYGRRPSIAEAKLAVGPQGECTTLTGDYAELKGSFNMAGLSLGRAEMSEPLPTAASATHQPVIGDSAGVEPAARETAARAVTLPSMRSPPAPSATRAAPRRCCAGGGTGHGNWRRCTCRRAPPGA
jgi:hypothetical protein